MRELLYVLIVAWTVVTVVALRTEPLPVWARIVVVVVASLFALVIAASTSDSEKSDE